jgi:hypothetical protein
MKLILGQAGIGDAIIFISYIYQVLDRKEKVYIDFDKDTINNYLDDPEGYYNFLQKFVHFLLPDDHIVVESNLQGEKEDINRIINFYNQQFFNFKYINARSKFPENRDNSAVVLNTKIRPLSKGMFQDIKKDFYKILNESNKKIILIGEKEIQYGKLYGQDAQNIVYSAYEDYIRNIDPSKLIDLTMPSFGRGSMDFDRLMNDMKIMAKYKNICFGTSGAFSITSCITDVISYAPNDTLSRFLDANQINIKIERNKFLTDLSNYLI